MHLIGVKRSIADALACFSPTRRRRHGVQSRLASVKSTERSNGVHRRPSLGIQQSQFLQLIGVVEQCSMHFAGAHLIGRRKVHQDVPGEGLSVLELSTDKTQHDADALAIGIIAQNARPPQARQRNRAAGIGLRAVWLRVALCKEHGEELLDFRTGRLLKSFLMGQFFLGGRVGVHGIVEFQLFFDTRLTFDFLEVFIAKLIANALAN
jgi:hypothetical protein